MHATVRVGDCRRFYVQVGTYCLVFVKIVRRGLSSERLVGEDLLCQKPRRRVLTLEVAGML